MPRVRIDLVDAENQPVTAELDIRRDTVEIRCRDVRRNRLVAVQDRQNLLDWLTNPAGVLSCDDTTWACGPGTNVSLYIADFVPSYFLRPHVVDRLKACLL